MPVTVVIPVCGKDAHLALATLQLIAGWEKIERRCVVAMERGFDAPEVVDAARLAFTEVAWLNYEPWHGSAMWPGPQNNAWAEVARAMAFELGNPWLWLEPDAVPLRKGWLQELEAEYQEKNQPVLACKTGFGNFNGVAIYAPDMRSVCPNMFLEFRRPFDVVLSQNCPGRVAETKLIAHHRKHVGGGVGRYFTSQNEIPDVAIFHGCTDGTLQRVLRGDHVQLVKREQVGTGVLPPILAQLYEPCPEPVRLMQKRWQFGKQPTMAHVVEMHKQRDEDSRKRVERAFHSWETLYEDGCKPCHVWEDDYPRDGRDIGDDRRLPYLKDILAAGLGHADIVVLTNDDTFLRTGLAERIREALAERPCVSSFRVNIDTPLGIDEPSMRGIDLGRDLFAFREDWLRKNWERIPDMLLGEVEWDMVLAAMVRFSNAEPFTLSDRGKPMPRSELPVGWVLHERHQPAWKGEPKPGRAHNRRLAAKWFVENRMSELAGR